MFTATVLKSWYRGESRGSVSKGSVQEVCTPPPQPRWDDLQLFFFPSAFLPIGNLGHITTFYPFLNTFPSSRFRVSHFLSFGGWQVCYASLFFYFIFFISVHLPLWLLVVCNSTHYTMLIKTLQTTSLHDLYFVYLIWNSSFVKVNRHLHSLLSLNQNLTLIHVLIPPNLTIQVLAS